MVTKQSCNARIFRHLSYSSEIIDGNKTIVCIVMANIASYSSEIIDGNKTHQSLIPALQPSYSSEIIDGNKTGSRPATVHLWVIF